MGGGGMIALAVVSEDGYYKAGRKFGNLPLFVCLFLDWPLVTDFIDSPQTSLDNFIIHYEMKLRVYRE